MRDGDLLAQTLQACLHLCDDGAKRLGTTNEIFRGECLSRSPALQPFAKRQQPGPKLFRESNAFVRLVLNVLLKAFRHQ